MLTRFAYINTYFLCTFQYYTVLKLKSRTVLHPLTFTRPLTSPACNDCAI